MDILYKIRFKSIAKFSTMLFAFGIFPLLTLLFFYDPIRSLLGLLLSYMGLVSTACIIYVLFFIKNKVDKMISLISRKVNSITDKKIHQNVKYSIIGIGIVLSIVVLYFAFILGSIMIKGISFISTLNPLMIIALNIYYVGISLSFLEYLKDKEA